MTRFDPSEFLADLKTQGHVRPGSGRPLVARGEEVAWLDGQVSNPTRIGLVGPLPTVTFEVFLQEIPAGQSSDMQRHHHETVHFVISGHGHSEVEDENVHWSAGDFVYTPPWTWHRHYNDSADAAVQMLGIENSRLLGALGLNRRQSAGLSTLSEARGQDPEADRA